MKDIEWAKPMVGNIYRYVGGTLTFKVLSISDDPYARNEYANLDIQWTHNNGRTSVYLSKYSLKTIRLVYDWEAELENL